MKKKFPINIWFVPRIIRELPAYPKSRAFQSLQSSISILKNEHVALKKSQK